MKEVWLQGYGVVRHAPETVSRIEELEAWLTGKDRSGDGHDFYRVLSALDRLTNAALWLVVHETYARRVYLDGRRLEADDFKAKPEGHTGGSLNMVPAYAGYLAANVLSGHTRAWLMGQGHCVAAIDSLNLLVQNMHPAHASRYALTDEGLTRYVRDFYSYRLAPGGAPDSPLGSHVGPETAGGISEGGYLGFAELQYIHMPLPGESLVAFLSDGAFEEQRGSDWAPRWWRAEDCGDALPIMIKNGRRIDQRTTMSQQGATEWFCDHLRLNGFAPVVFDGRDPAAFVWAIFEMERGLDLARQAVAQGAAKYPVRLPYGVAVAPKGAGFPGEGTNLAHNLPLFQNPAVDAAARDLFNEGAAKLFVPLPELLDCIPVFQAHARSRRPLERDNPLATRRIEGFRAPEVASHNVDATRRHDESAWTLASPMDAIDAYFAAAVRANPELRPRVGNPDEMRSNRLCTTLEALHFRVTDPEPGIPESVLGHVITALNEEAVVCAALANKGGINLVHTYEAFGPKMHGAVRQEIIFAKNQHDAGRPAGWLSFPVIMTSHTWENGKNEHSHQDPVFAETMLGEPAPFSRVAFPADYNTALAVMEALFATRGQIWTVVAPKAPVLPHLFSAAEARLLALTGFEILPWASGPEPSALHLCAVGAYQLLEVLRAARRLSARGISTTVSYCLEPAVLQPALAAEHNLHSFAATVCLTHTRPAALWGLWGPLRLPGKVEILGYRNEGGTLDTNGMLFRNRSSWAHVVASAVGLLGERLDKVLDDAERAALDGEVSPQGILFPAPMER